MTTATTTAPGASQSRQPSPALLMQLGLAYRGSAVLFAAIDLDIFSALAGGPKSAAELAAERGVDEEKLRLLLNACATEHMLTVADNRYANTEIVNAFLVRGSASYSANGFKYAENLYPAWGRLADLVRTGRPPMPPTQILGDNKAETRAFVMAMHERAHGIGSVLPHLGSLEGRRRLIDIGGGPGTYAVALVKQTPGLRATVLDVPGVLEVTRELVDASGCGDRVDLLPGDYLRTPFGSGYDAALLSGMMHRETRESCLLLLRTVHDAMVPGGLVMVSDVFFDDETKSTPPFAVYFALNMMLTSDHGSAHAKTEMAAWMREAGFTDVEIRNLPQPNPHTLILGTRR